MAVGLVIPIGDVIFGAGDDKLIVDGLTSTSGMLSTGIFDGGLGENSVFFNDFSLSNILSNYISMVIFGGWWGVTYFYYEASEYNHFIFSRLC